MTLPTRDELRYRLLMQLKATAETSAVGLDPDPYGAMADHVLSLLSAQRAEHERALRARQDLCAQICEQEADFVALSPSDILIRAALRECAARIRALPDPKAPTDG